MLKLNEKMIDFLQVLIGTAMMGFGISCFLAPNQLSSGGFSGIGTLIFYIFNISIGTVLLFLNVPLFIFTYLRNGMNFFIRSIVGTILLSVFINIFEKITPFTDDRFLVAIYGGVVIGIGNALVLKANYSTGGTELIAQIVKSYNKNASTSFYIVVMDIIIVIANVLYFRRIEIGLYSALTILIIGKMIDLIFEGINFSKMILIISNQTGKISEKIGKDIKRGVTGIYSKGMYSSKDNLMLLCVVPRNEVINVKKIAKEIDENSFIIITNAREVLGLGFKQ